MKDHSICGKIWKKSGLSTEDYSRVLWELVKRASRGFFLRDKVNNQTNPSTKGHC